MTDTEAVVLLVLMAEARTVENAHLSALGPALTRSSRDKLSRLGLIETTRNDRSPGIALSDDGWAYCSELIGSGVADGGTGTTRGLFTVLRSVGRYLERADVRPSEVFVPADEAHPVQDVEARIRTAYASLVGSPGGWVRLARLRTMLADVARVDLDTALERLRRAPDVSLVPEENQKTLTDDDRAAAVVVGNQQNHLLAIEQ